MKFIINKVCLILIMLIISGNLISQNSSHEEIHNEKFMSILLDIFDYKYIVHKNSFDKIIILENNIHYENKKDSIITLKNGNDEIVYYQAFGKIMLVKIQLNSRNIKLKNGYNIIGIEKSLFKNIFSLNFNSDKITIYETEGFLKCNICFKNNRIFNFSFENNYN